MSITSTRSTRWKITVEYQGSAYSGWQRQKDVPSIQQSIEEALTKFCQQDIRISGSGRTDAGVHARAQIAHFDLDYRDRDNRPRALSGEDLAKALNAHLRPQPISILQAEPVTQDFHARHSARGKLYHYRIIQRSAPLTMDQGLAWHIKKPLNVPAMHEAAQHLIGHHDFTSFRDSQCQAKSPMKTLDRIDVRAHNYDENGGTEIIIEVQGRSFLHHQVRNIAGTLSLVGEGKWSPLDVKIALEACDRTKGGPTAPAQGLYMIAVTYEK